MRFYQNDIAVVSYAGVFPQCENEDIFYQKLLQGFCAIEDLTKEGASPIEFKLHYSEDRNQPDKSYCKMGAQLPLRYFREWADKNALDQGESTAFEIAMHELFGRLEAKTPGLFQQPRTECVISMATGDPYSVRVRSRLIVDDLIDRLPLTADERVALKSEFEIIKDHPTRTSPKLKDVYGSLSYESIRRRFGIGGPCSFVDAACASSLAAMAVAVRRLQADECDLVISGGIDFGLGVLTLLAFSGVQVLSSGVMNPFDATTDGMNQGEAAALFALMRLSDAKAKGLKIYGVIRNCDGSSDGINGGLVEPTERGQVLAYERAYKDVPLEPLSYLECHGTGTKIGDRTELASSAKFFHPLPLIGSVKANVGHTIGAAGSVSLTKALKIIENKTIPRMPHFKNPIPGFSHPINTQNVELPHDKNVRIGVSSFGFGGANYHLVIDEYKNEELLTPTTSQAEFKFLLNGTATIDLEFVEELLAASRIKVPPVSLPHYDPAVLGGTLVTEKLFRELNLNLSPQLREQIGVISTSNNFLDRFVSCHDKAANLEVRERLDQTKLKNGEYPFMTERMKEFLPITEDTFPGALNNLIAGKVTKDFDLKGINFNISAEKTSLGIAMMYAKAFLMKTSGAFILLNFNEVLYQGQLKRTSAEAWLVSDQEFTLKADLPVLNEISAIRPQRRSFQDVTL